MAKTVIGQQQQQPQDEDYNWKGPDATRMSDTTSRHEVQETEYIMLAKLSPPQSKEKNKTLLINDWDNSSNGTTGEQAPPDLGTGQDTSATLCYYTPIPSHQEKTELSWLVHPKDSETQHRVKALSRWDHQVQHGNLDWILKRSKETLYQSSKPAYRLITDFQISRFVIGMPKKAGW